MSLKQDPTACRCVIIADMTADSPSETTGSPPAGTTDTVPAGGIWVALQVLAATAVLATAVLGPRPRRGAGVRLLAAAALAAAGVVTVLRARRSLGPAFSVFPRPVPGAPLTRSGPYAHIRHPMYAGVLAQGLAATLAGSPWALVPAGGLAVILDRKAAREERALAVAHPDAPPGPRWRFLPGVR
jgi:protein-S-isoprenylcysteine O-methyltransferase Ste14